MFTRRSRGQQGASAVEFALVMPLLFLVLFGIISFGIVFAQQLALGNAAREGARFGVVGSSTCADLEQAARDASSTIALDGSDATVEVKRGTSASTATDACGGGGTVVPCEGSDDNESLYVYVKYNSKLIIPVPTFGLIADPLPLRGEGVFRCEFS